MNTTTSVLVGVGAAVVCFVAGFAAARILAPEAPEPPPCPTLEAPPAPDLDALCADRVTTAADQLRAAQANVEALSGDLTSKQAELAAVQQELSKAKGQASALSAKAKKLEGEISGLQTRLTEATGERDKLVEELRDTLVQLDAQKEATVAAQRETAKWQVRTSEEAWRSFVAEAKVQICDRGTAKKHEACHDAVEAGLDTTVRNRFAACVGSNQAMPSLTQLTKGAGLPANAIALPDDKSFSTKGWFVILCDPSLPEAGEAEPG